MNKNFENRDFEHFVKQNADQYRMFPSEKVWKGINNTLHTRRRWYGIGLALLLLTTAAVTGIMLSPSGKRQDALANNSTAVTSKNSHPTVAESEIIITPAKSSTNKRFPVITPDNTQKNLFAVTTTATTNTKIVISQPVLNTLVLTEAPASIQEEEIIQQPPLNKPAVTVPKRPAKNETFYSIQKPATSETNTNIAEAKSTSSIEIMDDIDKAKHKEDHLATSKSDNSRDVYPMTIESVVNSYTRNNKFSKKVAWQLHVTPSITYRKLDDNKAFRDAARSSQPGSPPVYSLADINSVVTHKPDIGIQLGVSAGIPVSKTIKLTAGLQFNLSKYNIQVLSSNYEVATVALSNPAGGTSTVSTITNLRNIGGYRPSWLHNKYISASLPIGAEFKLSGKRKTLIGVGATVQPTYILGNRAYLLSTDLKNYVRLPSLTRKWNINTGFEIFAGYSTGKIDWRIGPQVRYQVFSSFYDTYPIKENLFDFGVKLGITLK